MHIIIAGTRRRAASGSSSRGGAISAASRTWQLKGCAIDQGAAPPHIILARNSAPGGYIYAAPIFIYILVIADLRILVSCLAAETTI